MSQQRRPLHESRNARRGTFDIAKMPRCQDVKVALAAAGAMRLEKLSKRGLIPDPCKYQKVFPDFLRNYFRAHIKVKRLLVLE